MRALRAPWRQVPSLSTNPHRLLALLVGSFAVTAGALGALMLMDASPAWQVLSLLALLLCAVLAINQHRVQILFACYVATLPIGIAKGLVAGSHPYYPALSITLSDIFLLLLILERALAAPSEEAHRIAPHRVLLAASLWLGWQWCCAVMSPNLLDGLLAAMTQTKYLIAMWLGFGYLRRPGFWRALVYGLAAAVILNVTVSALQIASGGSFEIQGIAGSKERALSFADAGILNLVRPSGLMSHPNELAGILVLALPGLLGALLLTDAVPAKARRACWLFAGLASTMLIMTLSRGGWIALAVGVIVFATAGWLNGAIQTRRIRKGIIGFTMIVLLSVVAFPVIYLRLTESDNRSTQSRLLLLQQAVAVVESAPVIGVGLSGYSWAAKHHLPPALSAFDDEYRRILSRSLVHNKYLLVTAECGLIGLILFLNVFRVAIHTALKTRYSNDPTRQVVALSLLGGLAALLTVFLAEPSDRGASIECTWLLMGAIAALSVNRFPPRQPKSGTPSIL